MIANRIAVQLKSLAQPFKKALHTAASLQADGVQIDARTELRPAELSATGLRQLRKMLDDLNLRVAGVDFPTRRGYANPDQLERRLDAAVEAMRLASQLGARLMIIRLGPIPEPPSSDEPPSPLQGPSRSTLLDALDRLTASGEKLGVQLACQASAAEPNALLELLQGFPEASLGVDLHPADLIAHGVSPIELVQTVGRHIVHVHATDAVRQLGSSDASTVELGRGTANIPELLGALEEFNYRGWITVERRNSRQPVEDCGNAVQFLRSLG